MRLPELNNTLTITDGKINDINTIKLKMESQLNALKARTSVSENVIDFKTIRVHAISGYTETNPILLRIYKEGKIIIDKQEAELKITWTVKLDTLYVLALSIGFVSLIFSSLVIELVFSIFVGIAVFFMLVFIGMLFILSSINELILSSVYKN